MYLEGEHHSCRDAGSAHASGTNMLVAWLVGIVVFFLGLSRLPFAFEYAEIIIALSIVAGGLAAWLFLRRRR